MIFSVLGISYLLSTCFSNALHYTDNFKFRNETVIRAIFPLLDNSPSLCVVSSDSELLSVFLEVCRDSFKPFSLSDSTTVPKSCTSVVILESDLSEDCAVFSATYNPSTTSYYLLSYRSTPDLSQLERCLSHSWAAEVLVVSLRDDTLSRLSPVFPTPRHFTPSSVDRVLQLRAKPNMPDLGGEVIKVATCLYPPFIMFDFKNSTIYTLEEMDGVELVILEQMALKLNFTVNTITVYYEQWGLFLPNNTWEGGMGQAMKDGTADMVLENVWFIPSFYPVVDFGPPMDQFEWSFLVRTPTQVRFQLFSLPSVFQWEVNLASFASFFVVVIAYWAGTNCDIRPLKKSLWDSVMIVFGYLAMTYSRTREGNTRFTLTSWSVFALLMATSLSTGIVQRLTLPVFTARVDSVQQLVEGGYYWTARFYKDFNETSLKSSFFDFENYWASLFEKQYQFLNGEEVANRAYVDVKITFPAENRGKYIVISTYGLKQHKGLRAYRMSKATVMKKFTSCFAVRKHSPLLEPLTRIANIFMETGLVQSWWAEVLNRYPEYDHSHVLKEWDRPVFSKPQPIKLDRIIALFLTLLIGLVIATLIFLAEITLNRMYH